MRIFLLGAGYVGMALLQQNSDPEVTFWASTTTESKLQEIEQYADKAFLIKGLEEERLEEILSQCDGMVIAVAPSSTSSYKETYYDTAKTVCKILKKRTQPFYLLYTGSTSVYGDHNGQKVHEDAERFPNGDNGKILTEVEDLYLSCASEYVTPCILRLGGIYGPGRDMAARARRFSGQELGGSGKEPTNSIHRDDIVDAIKFSLKGYLKGVYNVVCDDHRCRKELYSDLCNALNIAEPHWNPEKAAMHGSNCIVMNDKICKEGFKFSYSKVTLDTASQNNEHAQHN